MTLLPSCGCSLGYPDLGLCLGSRDSFTRSHPHSTCCSWPHMHELWTIWTDWVTNVLPSRSEHSLLLFHPRAQKKWYNNTLAFQINNAFFLLIFLFSFSPGKNYLIFYCRDQQTLTIKDQILNTLKLFLNNTVSVMTTQLCHCSMKTAIDNKWMNLDVFQ